MRIHWQNGYAVLLNVCNKNMKLLALPLLLASIAISAADGGAGSAAGNREEEVVIAVMSGLLARSYVELSAMICLEQFYSGKNQGTDRIYSPEHCQAFPALLNPVTRRLKVRTNKIMLTMIRVDQDDLGNVRYVFDPSAVVPLYEKINEDAATILFLGRQTSNNALRILVSSPTFDSAHIVDVTVLQGESIERKLKDALGDCSFSRKLLTWDLQQLAKDPQINLAGTLREYGLRM